MTLEVRSSYELIFSVQYMLIDMLSKISLHIAHVFVIMNITER